MKSALELLLACAFFGGLITWAYHADKTEIINQYGPRTTASGRQVTVFLVEDGFMSKKYTVYTEIIDESGFDIKTDMFDTLEKDDAYNIFGTYIQWVKEGRYETIIRVCERC